MGLILQGLSQEHLVGKDEGWVYLKEALLLGEKDHLILPFAGLVDLLPFIERFPALKGGDFAYRATLLHEARYHQSLFPQFTLITPASLSKREKQLLAYLEEGESRLEIARLLYIQENTVKSELGVLDQKLGVHSRYEAVALIQKK